MPVTLRQVEIFQLVMKTRNLTETARLLRLSQPAISQALKEMEAQLGLSLFERSGNRISPTGEARMLLPEMERLLLTAGAVESRAAELRDHGAGSLSISSTTNAAGILLPPAIANMTRLRPRVQISLHAHVGREEVVRQVRQEGADLGLLYAPIDDRALAVEPLMRTRMVCAMTPSSPLAAMEEVTTEQLRGVNVIVSANSSTPGLLFRSKLIETKVRLERLVETNFSYAGLGLAQHGLGVFVTDPLILLAGGAEELVVRPLVPELPLVLSVVYARQRPLPRLAVQFVKELRLVIAEMSERPVARIANMRSS
jgi:DNA-binding transcriptional LysR family regulator